jgi:hypothetical protein
VAATADGDAGCARCRRRHHGEHDGRRGVTRMRRRESARADSIASASPGRRSTPCLRACR